MKKLNVTRRGALGLAGGALAALFIPSCNQAQGVYGPPEWFDPSHNEPEDVYGPPPMDDDPDFDPEDNVVVAVYGPPEWFEGAEATSGSAAGAGAEG